MSARRGIAGWAIAIFAAVGLATSSVALAAPIDVTPEPIEVALADGSAPRVGQFELLAAFDLSSASPEWGGLSGTVVSPDGRDLTVVADTGLWHRLLLRHDRDGRLTAVGNAASGRLKDEQGKPLRAKSVGDAEALMRAADGSLYVSFEHWHRLWRYGPAKNPLLAAAKYVRGPKALASLPRNGGIEAATILKDGRLLLLSEDGRTDSGDRRGWLGTAKKWAEISLAPTGDFKPTDLTVLPSGDVLLLERRLSLFGGFAARLSVIGSSDVKAGARLQGRELAVVQSPLPVDNFEAVAARPAPDGSVLIYLLSDNNFSEMERTLLLQFRWRP